MPEVTRTNDTPERTVEATPESSTPIIQDFNGKPTILLNPGSRWPFSLGLNKVKIVLANIQFLQRFYDSKGTSVE